VALNFNQKRERHAGEIVNSTDGARYNRLERREEWGNETGVWGGKPEFVGGGGMGNVIAELHKQVSPKKRVHRWKC